MPDNPTLPTLGMVPAKKVCYIVTAATTKRSIRRITRTFDSLEEAQASARKLATGGLMLVGIREVKR